MENVLEGDQSLFDQQLDWDSLLENLPDFKFDDFFPEIPPVAAVANDEAPSPNPALSEIENLLMNDAVDGQETPSSESDYDKLLADILVEPRSESEEDGSVPTTPEVSKKQIRQMRNRDAAVKSRERKKMYVNNLEMKSRFYEGECRRLGHLLQCCYAENHALRLCLQSRGAFGAPVAMQESAVLLLELLLLGSLLWFTGIMCQLSLPLILWLAVSPPRENMEQKGLRRVAQKGPESKICEYFLTESFVKSYEAQTRTREQDTTRTRTLGHR